MTQFPPGRDIYKYKTEIKRGRPGLPSGLALESRPFTRSAVCATATPPKHAQLSGRRDEYASVIAGRAGRRDSPFFHPHAVPRAELFVPNLFGRRRFSHQEGCLDRRRPYY